MKVLLEKNHIFAIIIIVMVILFSPLPAQYKVGYRIGLGIGFTKPDKFNDSLAEQEMSKIGSAWFPLNYDLSVNFPPAS